MSSNVFRIIFFRKEILFAMFALMRFNLQMNPFSMINQGRISFESTATFRTKETLDVLMDTDLMDSECRSSSEPFGTIWT